MNAHMAMPMGLEPTITGETVRRISHYATAPYKQDIVKDLNLLVSVLQTNSLPKVFAVLCLTFYKYYIIFIKVFQMFRRGRGPLLSSTFFTFKGAVPELGVCGI